MEWCDFTNFLAEAIWWVIAAACGLGSFMWTSARIDRRYATDPARHRVMSGLALLAGMGGFFIGFNIAIHLPFMPTLLCL